MCGICGIVGHSAGVDAALAVRAMAGAMLHRGPDEGGELIAPGAALAMRRLSILDLPGGHQPLWNETEALAVIFNGEIYNFRDLQRELEGRGHRFRTHSDTEVIVHAYEEWGEACAERLLGMFAFAIAEMPNGPSGRITKVFLARDRMGIKPLYYHFVPGRFVFASEVRALMASGLIDARLSGDAISSYLLFGSVGEPLTLLEGVFELPPGHGLTVNTADLRQVPKPRRYWNFKPGASTQPPSSNGKSARTPAQRVRSLLESAVRSHLIADVPVGVFLSSGLDSTALAAIASRVQAGIHTFTVCFTDEAFSEAEMARRMAHRLGTTHQELKLSGDEMTSRLDEAVDAFDQPSMDGVNSYFVSWAARQAGLKVALSGLGGDELFGGYTSFRATSKLARAADWGRALPAPVRRPAAKATEKILSARLSRDAARKAAAALASPADFPHPYFFTRLLFAPQAAKEAGSGIEPEPNAPAWKAWLADAAAEAASADEFTAVSWLELRSYLLNTLLRDTDAMSMRSSLEVRVPFLDAPLAEYVLSLPESAKLDRARPKALLIEAVRDLLPEEILAQQKRTFTFPWEKWLRGGLGERVRAGLADWSPALEPYVGAKFARSVWEEFLAGRITWSRPWSLYVLNEWVRRNLRAGRLPMSGAAGGFAARSGAKS